MLDAAECLFAEHGYTGTSLRMISQQASVNIASANYYFGGKEGLWKAVMMKYAPQARDFRISMMNEAMEKGTVRALAHAYVYPSFHGLLHVKLEELGNFPHYLRLLGICHVQTPEIAVEYIKEVYSPIRRRLHDCIRTMFPGASTYQVFWTVLAIESIMIGLLTRLRMIVELMENNRVPKGSVQDLFELIVRQVDGTTSAKAEFIDQKVMDKIYDQMRQLNKYARDIMVKYDVHSCTDVTGFGLLGHGYEMAQGSNVTIHFMTEEIPYHKEALEMADLGMIPEGAYRNRKYASAGVSKAKELKRAMEDILYDPQTSGGLMIAVDEKDAKNLLKDLQNTIPCAKIIGYVEDKEEKSIILE